MPSFLQVRSLLGAGAFVSTSLVFVALFTPRGDTLGADKPGHTTGAGDRTVSYLKEVRPILAQHCFQCHGPDEAARKGKLRLDLKAAAPAARASKPVIAPGSLDGSLVWARITASDKSERMPPAETVQPLSEKEIATLKVWIEQGAKWEDHWSFLAPAKPAVPKVSNQAWV